MWPWATCPTHPGRRATPGEHGMLGGSRYELKWDGCLPLVMSRSSVGFRWAAQYGAPGPQVRAHITWDVSAQPPSAGLAPLPHCVRLRHGPKNHGLGMVSESCRVPGRTSRRSGSGRVVRVGRRMVRPVSARLSRPPDRRLAGAGAVSRCGRGSGTGKVVVSGSAVVKETIQRSTAKPLALRTLARRTGGRGDIALRACRPIFGTDGCPQHPSLGRTSPPRRPRSPRVLESVADSDLKLWLMGRVGWYCAVVRDVTLGGENP